MRVLHFYKTCALNSTGGVEVFMDTLCNATADFGVENTILSLADKPESTPVNLPRYQVIQAKQNVFVASTGFSISAFSQFKRLAEQADIIHYHFPNPFADILHFCCQVKKPTVLTYHSDIVKQKLLLKLYQPLMHRFLHSVDRIIATSPNYFATSSRLQAYKDKVNVIPIAINKVNCSVVSPAKIQYWQNKLTQPFFLFIGALRYYKGLHFLLDAVKATDLQLVLAGTGGTESTLKAQARQSALHNVYFPGLVSDEDKAALLHLCYGFVFPSHLRSEAFGIALLEAASYGKPLISCEIGTGTSFINVDQQTGLVVEPGSPDALRHAMQYLLANPVKAAEFGRNAEARHKSLFTLDKQAKAYVEVYKHVLHKKQRAGS